MTYKDLQNDEFIKKLFDLSLNLEECMFDEKTYQFFFECIVLKREISNIIKNEEMHKPRFIKRVMEDVEEFKKRNKEYLILFNLIEIQLPIPNANQSIFAENELTGEEYKFDNIDDVSVLFGKDAIDDIISTSKYHGFTFDVR